MPSAVSHLRALGIDPPGVDLRGITYLSADESLSATADFPRELGRGVRRTVLSQTLTDVAQSLGVKIVTARVDAIHQEAHQVEAAGIRAPWLIAADGLKSGTREQLQLTRRRRPFMRYGLVRHFQMSPWTDRVTVLWAQDSEAYVTPVSSDCVGVAILCGRGTTFERELAKFPLLQQRVRHAMASPVRGAGPLFVQSRARVSGRALLVGDAAGYIDALTGEGLSVGFAQAQAAVNALVRGEPNAYDRDYARVTRLKNALTYGLLSLSQSRFRPHLLPAAARIPGLMALGVRLAS